MNTKQFITIATVSLLSVSIMAQSKTFKIGEAGGMKVSQTFTVESKADFENFVGQTHKVSGMLKFDPSKKVASGKISVDISTIDTGIPMRNEHMKSDMWMNTEKFPIATFETTSVKHKQGDTYSVKGKLTVHGVTKDIATEANIKYIKESEATKKAMFMGDVARLTCDFKINLKDYGIMIPEMAGGKVSPTMNLHLDVFAYTG